MKIDDHRTMSNDKITKDCWVCGGAGVEWSDTNVQTKCSNPDCVEGKVPDPECNQKRPAEPVEPAEPVAWMLDTTDGKRFMATDSKHNGDWLPLYAAPATVPLTDEQIDELWAECMDRYPSTTTIINLARAIERAHGIGDKT